MHTYRAADEKKQGKRSCQVCVCVYVYGESEEREGAGVFVSEKTPKIAS